MMRFSRRLIPNGLSLLRLGLGVAFPWLPVDWRFSVIAVAAVTDGLDGAAARWLRCTSETGQVLDPLADKVFVLMLVSTLIAEGVLVVGEALAVGARDVVVLAGVAATLVRGRWADYGRMRPTRLGKCTTAVQFVFLLALVAWGRSRWLLLVTAGLSIFAALDYARLYLRRPSA